MLRQSLFGGAELSKSELLLNSSIVSVFANTTALTKLSTKRLRCLMLSVSIFLNRWSQNKICSFVSTGFLMFSFAISICKFCLRCSNSSNRCLVDGVIIPCSIALRTFSMLFSVSASCFLNSGTVVFSWSCSQYTRSAIASKVVLVNQE